MDKWWQKYPELVIFPIGFGLIFVLLAFLQFILN